jgi:hypothetical protein
MTSASVFTAQLIKLIAFYRIKNDGKEKARIKRAYVLPWI